MTGEENSEVRQPWGRRPCVSLCTGLAAPTRASFPCLGPGLVTPDLTRWAASDPRGRCQASFPRGSSRMTFSFHHTFQGFAHRQCHTLRMSCFNLLKFKLKYSRKTIFQEGKSPACREHECFWSQRSLAQEAELSEVQEQARPCRWPARGSPGGPCCVRY